MKKNLKMVANKGTLQILGILGVIGFSLIVSNSLAPVKVGEKSFSYNAPTQAGFEKVSLMTLDKKEFTPEINLTGVVEARVDTLLAPEVGGRVVYISPNLKAGGIVEKDEVLLKVDPIEYELNVEATLAELEAAKSNLEIIEAEAEIARKDWLLVFPDEQIPSLVAKEPQIAAARARVNSAKALNKIAELNKSRTIIKSPFRGRVMESTIDLGQLVNKGQNFGKLYSFSNLEIVAPIKFLDLKAMGELKGRKVEIFRGKDKTQRGTIDRMDGVLNPRTRMATLFVRLDEPEGFLAGEFLSFSIKGQINKDVLALRPEQLVGSSNVWVVEGERLNLKEVNVVGEDEDFLFVSNFDHSSKVVLTPPTNAKIGQKVVVNSNPNTFSLGGHDGK